MSNTKQRKESVCWLWVAAAFAVAVLVAQGLMERGENPYFRAAGVASLLLSPIFIFPPFLLLLRHGRPPRGQPYCCTTAVVNHGVYSIVRHPQYVGYGLLTLGFAALSQNALISILAVCSAIAFYVQSIKEEAFLIKQVGQDYAKSMRRVPRFNFLVGMFHYLFARKG